MGTATKPSSPAPVEEHQQPSHTGGYGYANPPQSSTAYPTAGTPAHGIPVPPPMPQGYPAPAAPPVHGPQPYPGYIIRPPRVLPQPGQVIVGYEIYQPEAGCCQCEGMSAAGLISIIVLLLVCWPLAWIPCVMQECFDTYQSPVYGYPQQLPPQSSPYPPGAPQYPYSSQ